MMSKKIIAMLTALVMVLGCTGALAENTKHERVLVAPERWLRIRSTNGFM